MIDVIPEKYQLLVGIVALTGALAAAAAGGAVVNGWRLDGAHQRELAEKREQYDALASKVREQSRAVEVMRLKSEAAEGRRKLAEFYAADVLKRLGHRSEVVASSKAPDCAGVMREAWGVWQ
jgi:hypothetical protein